MLFEMTVLLHMYFVKAAHWGANRLPFRLIAKNYRQSAGTYFHFHRVKCMMLQRHSYAAISVALSIFRFMSHISRSFLFIFLVSNYEKKYMQRIIQLYLWYLCNVRPLFPNSFSFYLLFCFCTLNRNKISLNLNCIASVVAFGIAFA